MDYQIQLDIFQGPLDLLLHLIEKDEIDIYNIPIALITEKYLEYLQTIQMLNLETVGDFLVMAATLMQIKAKLLLPQSQSAATTEADAAEEDPRWELAQKLIEYKKIKEATRSLITLESEQLQIYPRSGGEFADQKLAPEADPIKNLSIWDLMEAFKAIIESQFTKDFDTIPKQEVSVKQRMNEILALIQNEGRVYFKQVFAEIRSKIGLITCFLAVLELIRLKQIVVFQEALFSDIRLSLPEKVMNTQ
ncbi:condensin subunit ScpA [Hydrogenispora ethanolica]|uniref:Segregation and condensation protein A n=1 Tax=Hydrogenispora ethanolica TaxID=1082276 RepID=A0A4R1RB85_HYDET|nr:segregation/condensation protein A [Hydrogenispora ethanolica]TCL62996.1 condensin subunit ScpA [Hydrogenispora ethanolica]